MPTFEELKQRYMVTGVATGGSSLSGSTTSSIPAHAGCHVTPHIGGSSYFTELKSSINALSGDGAFVYIAGWWLQPGFSLDGQTGSSMVDLLKAKARAGVDVRVLGWVFAPEILQSRILRTALSTGGASLNPARSFLQQHDETMNTILALRTEPALADKAALNTLAHPAGAVHMKFAMVGDNNTSSFFTGGLDLLPDRWDPSWHDVQAEVAGPVVQDAYNAYRDMWNEIQGRPAVRLTALHVTCDNRTSAMPTLPTRTVHSVTSSRMHVQSLRTLPQFNFSTAWSSVLPTNNALSYARNGLFETRAAWHQAISGAQTYIYIEDQGFTSREVFDWINARIKADDDLRVILVTGMPDPNDAPGSPLPKFFSVAVNSHLLNGLTAAQRDRVGIFKHRTAVIHAKTTLIDDHWALIGSANCMRRSLYTDFEHSVSFMDEDSHNAVVAYRTDLWGTHVPGISHPLPAALSEWFAIPYAGSGGTTTAHVDRLRLPLTSVTLTSTEQALYDEIYDTDSRQTWGTTLWRLLNASGGSGGLSP